MSNENVEALEEQNGREADDHGHAVHAPDLCVCFQAFFVVSHHHGQQDHRPGDDVKRQHDAVGP